MKFLFIVSDFAMGGVTSSMRNLCNDLIKQGHNVDILDLPNEGRLPNGFSDEIRLITLTGRTKYWNLGMHTVRKSKGLKRAYLLFIGFVKKLCNRSNVWNRIVFSDLELQDSYDVAIGFRQSPVCYWIAAKRSDAKVSIGFWHTDPAFEDIGKLKNSLKYPDRIACVSKAVTQQMQELFPQYYDKFGTVYNLFDAESIRQKCGDQSPYSNDYFNLITVSRLENTPKKIDMIPEICRIIEGKTSKPFHWFIVGDGPDRTVIEKHIKESGTSGLITLTGEQNNPYMYMKFADLFVLCSTWESYGMVIMEALITGTPVVAGDYPALHEIISDGVNGVISENSAVGIADAIIRLLNNEDLYQNIKSGAKQYEYHADIAYQQLIELVRKEHA